MRAKQIKWQKFAWQEEITRARILLQKFVSDCEGLNEYLLFPGSVMVSVMGQTVVYVTSTSVVVVATPVGPGTFDSRSVYSRMKGWQINTQW